MHCNCSVPGPGWVAGRFDEVDRACDLLNPQRLGNSGINIHSGKWNHHYHDGWCPQTAAFNFAVELNAVLETPIVLDPDGLLPGEVKKTRKRKV